MTEERTLVLTCDEPGCTEMIEVPVLKGHWLYQPWQSAINLGWEVGTKDYEHDYCPAHSRWFPRVPR